MRIKIKNIPKDKVSKAEIGEATEYFLTKLIGEEKVKGLGLVEVSFRKMKSWKYGRALVDYTYSVNQRIIINSIITKDDIFKTLAHECTHVKQYFLKELRYEIDTKSYFNGSRRKRVTIWKGKRILRSNYRKRAWEVEARKYEKLANNLKKKLEKGNVAVVEKPKVKLPEVKNIIEGSVIMELANGDIKNGELLDKVLEGKNNDKQYRMQVLKTIFKMKEEKLIEEYHVESITWVRIKKGE